ncbi:MAG: GNAT family N-acetyltransferase [Chlamydiales bacterium]|nr:GNAT family N-acetyltransferase [Chlamydiales bacterium]
MSEKIPGFEIRYTQLTDASNLKEWLNAPGMLHWFPMQEEKEIEDAAQAWASFSRWSCSLTCTIDGVPCAIGTLFLMPYRKVAHHCLIKVIVDPKFQRRGVGTELIKNLKHLAKSYFRLQILHVEVYEGNPLVKLLQKEGFRQFAKQERFVKEGETYLARLLFECFL